MYGQKHTCLLSSIVHLQSPIIFASWSIECLTIKRRRLNFLFYGRDRTYFSANQNINNIDFTYKHLIIIGLFLI